MTANRDLFGNRTIVVPPTEGIKYAGSKLKMLPHILEIIADLPIKRVLDGFSGSTRVSQALAQSGYEVAANDVSIWSATLAKAYLLNPHPPQFYAPLIQHLNSLKGIEGWFSEHYGGRESGDEKRPFQLKNTQKLDAIRSEIDRLELSDIERSVALTSLILALDAVDNTLGHYAAYLSDWSPRSYNDLQLRIPHLWINQATHQVSQADVFDCLQQSEQQYDLIYLDPPYGSNNEKMPPSRVRYGAYYHIWKTVILNDQPTLFGKVNRREDSRDEKVASVFEDFRRDEAGKFVALNALEQLIKAAKAPYLLLSYSSGGRATKAALHDILEANGKLLRALEVDYKRNVMSQMRWTNQWINSEGAYLEYLFLIEKN